MFLVCDCDDGAITASSPYPILIPAKTVCDLWFAEPWSRFMLIIEASLDGPEGFFKIDGNESKTGRWLRTHTKEGT